MHQDNVGPPIVQHRTEALQNCAHHIGQILIGTHDIEVEIGFQSEEVKYLVQHFAMLRSYAQSGIEARVISQCDTQWGHFYCFGSSANY
jgi:hypothetical protein